VIYLVTICLLLTYLYLSRGGEHENRPIEQFSIIALLISAVYGIYLSNLKKKISAKK